MNDPISFTVRGTPTPKGSTTRMPGGGTIPAGTPASRARMYQWRDDLRREATEAMEGQPPFTTAIRLFIEISLMPPKSVRKAVWGWLPHTKKPDVDKLLRAVCDALTGIVWVDDAQVSICSINKRYAWDGITGAIVSVEPITEDYARKVASATKALREVVQ